MDMDLNSRTKAYGHKTLGKASKESLFLHLQNVELTSEAGF